MKTEDTIKETIKIYMDFFKVYVVIVIVLSGGIFGVLMKLIDKPVHEVLIVLFAGGLVFLLISLFAAIYRYIAIIKLLKKLK